MLDMAISEDNRFVAAFTSSNQLIVLDVMLGHWICVEKPMDTGDKIVNVCFTAPAPDGNTDDQKVVVYNSKYYRYFDCHFLV